MLILKGEILLAIFPIIKGMVAKSDRSSLMFYKIPGMKSNATHTKDISGIPAENCMAFCLDDERCRAFTAIRGSAASPSRCLLYDYHVCKMI